MGSREPHGRALRRAFSARGKASQADIALRNELQLLISSDAEAEANFCRHFVALRMDGFDLTGDRFADMPSIATEDGTDMKALKKACFRSWHCATTAGEITKLTKASHG